jgi:hypothetical protein
VTQARHGDVQLTQSDNRAETFSAKLRLPRKAAALIAACCALFIVSALGAYAYLTSTVDITELLPADVDGVCSVDSTWLWTNSAFIRSQPTVANALLHAKEETGISIGSDIAPWLGRVVVAKLHGPNKRPRIAVFAQITNSSEFANELLKVQNSDQAHHKFVIRTMSIDGRQVTEVSPIDHPWIKVDVTVQKGWLVATYGNGTLQDLVEVWSRRQRNITTNTAYVQVLNRIDSGESQIWAAGDAKDLVADLPPKTKAMAGTSAHGIEGGSLIDKGTTLDLLDASYSEDSKTTAIMKKFSGKLAPITPSSMAIVPNNASAAYFVSSPGVLIDTAIGLFKDTSLPASEKPMVDGVVANVKKFRNIYMPLTGVAGMSFIYSEGQFGATLSAATESPSSAISVAQAIAQAVWAISPTVHRSGNKWTLYTPKGMPPSPFNPAMRVVKNNVQLATSQQWLESAEGHTALILPAESEGSATALVVSFKQIGTLLKSAPGPISTVVTRTSLQNANITAWAKVDPSGQVGSGTFRISNLDWKATIIDLYKTFASQYPMSVHAEVKPVSPQIM